MKDKNDSNSLSLSGSSKNNKYKKDLVAPIEFNRDRVKKIKTKKIKIENNELKNQKVNQEKQKELNEKLKYNENKYFNYDKRLINFPKFENDEIKEAFDCFDINGGGSISAQELKFIFRSLGEEVQDEEVDEMIRLADREGDGQVNFKNFYEFITGLGIDNQAEKIILDDLKRRKLQEEDNKGVKDDKIMIKKIKVEGDIDDPNNNFKYDEDPDFEPSRQDITKRTRTLRNEDLNKIDKGKIQNSNRDTELTKRHKTINESSQNITDSDSETRRKKKNLQVKSKYVKKFDDTGKILVKDIVTNQKPIKPREIKGVRIRDAEKNNDYDDEFEIEDADDINLKFNGNRDKNKALIDNVQMFFKGEEEVSEIKEDEDIAYKKNLFNNKKDNIFQKDESSNDKDKEENSMLKNNKNPLINLEKDKIKEMYNYIRDTKDKKKIIKLNENSEPSSIEEILELKDSLKNKELQLKMNKNQIKVIDADIDKDKLAKINNEREKKLERELNKEIENLQDKLNEKINNKIKKLNEEDEDLKAFENAIKNVKKYTIGEENQNQDESSIFSNNDNKLKEIIKKKNQETKTKAKDKDKSKNKNKNKDQNELDIKMSELNALLRDESFKREPYRDVDTIKFEEKVKNKFEINSLNDESEGKRESESNATNLVNLADNRNINKENLKFLQTDSSIQNSKKNNNSNTDSNAVRNSQMQIEDKTSSKLSKVQSSDGSGTKIKQLKESDDDKDFNSKENDLIIKNQLYNADNNDKFKRRPSDLVKKDNEAMNIKMGDNLNVLLKDKNNKVLNLNAIANKSSKKGIPKDIKKVDYENNVYRKKDNKKEKEGMKNNKPLIDENDYRTNSEEKEENKLKIIDVRDSSNNSKNNSNDDDDSVSKMKKIALLEYEQNQKISRSGDKDQNYDNKPDKNMNINKITNITPNNVKNNDLSEFKIQNTSKNNETDFRIETSSNDENLILKRTTKLMDEVEIKKNTLFPEKNKTIANKEIKVNKDTSDSDIVDVINKKIKNKNENYSNNISNINQNQDLNNNQNQNLNLNNQIFNKNTLDKNKIKTTEINIKNSLNSRNNERDQMEFKIDNNRQFLTESSESNRSSDFGNKVPKGNNIYYDIINNRNINNRIITTESNKNSKSNYSNNEKNENSEKLVQTGKNIISMLPPKNIKGRNKNEKRLYSKATEQSRSKSNPNSNDDSGSGNGSGSNLGFINKNKNDENPYSSNDHIDSEKNDKEKGIESYGINKDLKMEKERKVKMITNQLNNIDNDDFPDIKIKPKRTLLQDNLIFPNKTKVSKEEKSIIEVNHIDNYAEAFVNESSYNPPDDDTKNNLTMISNEKNTNSFIKKNQTLYSEFQIKKVLDEIKENEGNINNKIGENSIEHSLKSKDSNKRDWKNDIKKKDEDKLVKVEIESNKESKNSSKESKNLTNKESNNSSNNRRVRKDQMLMESNVNPEINTNSINLNLPSNPTSSSNNNKINSQKKQLNNSYLIKKENKAKILSDFNTKFNITPFKVKNYYTKVQESNLFHKELTFDEFVNFFDLNDSEETKLYFDVFSSDKGKIGIKNSLILMLNTTNLHSEEKFKFAFLLLDEENSGYISKNELEILIKLNFKLNNGDINEIRKRINAIEKELGSNFIEYVKDFYSYEDLYGLLEKRPLLLYP